MRYIPIFFWLFFLATFIWADEPATEMGKWTHESEAGIVIASGNSDTQTYNVKQLTAHTWVGNTVRVTGSYLLGKTSGVETAKKWDLGVRYDRAITEKLSAFLGYQIDSSPFAGTYLRHTIDLGARYSLIKNQETEIATEVGYRPTAETFTLDNGKTKNGSLTSHMSRAYVEWKQNWNKSITSKLWAEYLQSYTNTKDYRFSLEPSISVILSEIFSVKVAYLLNYRNVPAVAGKKQTDGLYTTSLVAKF
jgi:putative salt-induced outer membrane protein